MAEINDHCLFCLSKIAPFTVSQRKANQDPPNFNDLCEMLEVKFTDETLQQLKSVPVFLNGSGSFEQFLCLVCFEMVESLRELYEEVKKLQEQIVTTTGEMRRRITEQIDGSVVTALKNEGTGKRGRRKKNAVTVEFVEVFQRLVKESRPLSLACLNDDPVSNEDEEKGPAKPGVSKAAKSRKKKTEDEAAASAFAKRRKEENCGIDLKIKQENEREDSLPENVNVKMEDLSSYYEDAEESTDFDQNFEHFTEEDEDNYDVAGNSTKGIILEVTQTEPNKAENDCSKIILEGQELRKKKSVVKKRSPNKSRLGKPSKKKQKLSQSVQKYTCDHCSQTFPTISKYRYHITFHDRLTIKSLNLPTTYRKTGAKKEKLYSCSLCQNNKKYDKLSRFHQHTMTHEATSTNPSTPPLSCDQCDSQFVLKLNLDLHKLCTHRFKRLYLKCDQCRNSRSGSREELIAHLKTHNGTTSLHSCKSCPMVSSTLNNLISHIMTKHSASKKLICPECDHFTSATVRELMNHCKQTHSDKLADSLNCHLCDKSYLFPIKLRNHLRVSHSIFGNEEEKPREKLFCSICANGKEYKTKVSFDNHLLFMHSDVPKPFQCDQCERSYLYKSQLQHHIDDKHVRHQCPHCPNSYKGQVQLDAHLKTHTGQGLFPCEVCGKQFPRKTQLRVHSVTHLDKTGGKECVCEICGKEFVHEIHLRKHRSTHTDKKLECKHCKMLFRRPDHLRSHLRTHTGERPFMCPVCSKDFNRRDIMIVHMSTHGYGIEEARQVYKEHLEKMKVEGS